MSIPDLSYFVDAKRPLSPNNDSWDIFVSAYNDSDRVKRIFASIHAKRKAWWMLPEYNYQLHEFPTDGDVVADLHHEHEADLIRDALAQTGPLTGRVAFDVTGLMRPHILFLMNYLLLNGVTRYDFIYTEPEHYSRRVDTAFSKDETSIVRQVAGYEGQHTPDTTNDILILGVGYDHPLISRVVSNKEKARTVQLHSLPSLSADMYHEALLRLDSVGMAGASEDSIYFSSANDPYVTASVLSGAIKSLNSTKPVTNLYLSTLATKPQAIGFGLFYLTELRGSSSSIIFPCTRGYERETGKGLGRSWVYPIEL